MLVTLSTLTRARSSQNSCGSFCKSNICERKLRLPQPSTSRVKCGTLPPHSTLDVWLRGGVISAQSQVWEVGDGFLIIVMEPMSPVFRSVTNAVIRRAKGHRGEFIEHAETVVLIDDPGTGKTGNDS